MLSSSRFRRYFYADKIIFFFILLQVVCKHWLRGLCKKGDGCEFLHEYDMTKMPECYFYSRFSKCQRVQCVSFTMCDKYKEKISIPVQLNNFFCNYRCMS